uniref:DUF7507 domain-containing protein n=1 Tax=Winogradskyella costae TaxID=2697008 RepID=UPI0015CE5FF2
IDQDDVDLGSITNSATATGDSPSGTDDVSDVSDNGDETVDGPDVDTDPTNDPTITPIVQDAALTLTKTVAITTDASPAGTSLGDVLTYTFSVTNTGNVTVDNITIADAFTGTTGLAISPSSLVPGATGTATVTYTIDQDDVDLGSITNSATATGDSPSGTDDVSDVSDNGDETVDGPDVDTDPTNDPTITPIVQDAALTLTKTVAITTDASPTGTSLGDVLTYTFSVTNTGNVTVDNITIADAFTGTTGLVISPSSLVPGATGTATVTYTIDQDDVDLGSITNSATATGDSPSGTDDVSDVSDNGDELADGPDADTDPTNDPTVTPIVQDAALTLTKTVAITTDASPTGTSLGDVLTYTFSVTNTGNVTVDNITIADAFTGTTGLAISPSSLVPGATGTATVTYTIDQDDVDLGSITNSATATGDSPSGTDDVSDVSDNGDETVDGPDVDTDPTNDPTVTPIVQDAALTLTKTVAITTDASPAGTSLGDVLTYTFSVTNTGNVTVDNITIADAFTGTTGLAISPSSLVPGATGTATVTYTIDQDDVDLGSITNSATATGDSPSGTDDVSDVSDNGDELADGPDADTDPTNDPTVTPIVALPSLEAVKTVALTTDVLPTGLSLGDTMTYTITVENTGNVSLDNVAITDTFVDANGNTLTLLTGPTFNSSDAGSAEGLLAVGETATYTATYVIEQDAIDAGGFSNSVLVEGDSPAGTTVDDTSDDDDDADGNTEDDATVTTITASPSLEAVKTVAISNDVLPTGLSLGDTMTYTITVENTGNVSLDNVAITDTFVDANGNTLTLLTGPTFNSSDAGSAEGLLAVGETATYTATYVIEQDAIDAGGFSNSVLVEGDSPAGTTVDDTSDDDDDSDGNTEDDATVATIASNPSISLIKTTLELEDTNGDGTAGGLGDLISYVFTVENTGNVTLTDIVVVDNLPGLNLVGGSIGQLLPGEIDSTTFTATYEITQADLDEGNVTNSATVSSEGPRGDLGNPSDDIVDTSDDPNNLDNIDANGDGNPDDPTVTIVNSLYDLEVTKIVDVLEPVIGSQVIFTIEVANIGNVTATDVIISEQIPSGYDYVSHISTTGNISYSDITGEWILVQLDPDQVEILEITVEVLGFGDYLNIAYIDSSVGGIDVNEVNDESSAEVDPICLTIYNEFSPNGDNVNETFVIDCLERYTDNKLEIYNRWGNLVYSKRGYLNDWNGSSNGRSVINKSDELPVGTYYYVLDLGDGSDPRVGWVYLNR